MIFSWDKASGSMDNTAYFSENDSLLILGPLMFHVFCSFPQPELVRNSWITISHALILGVFESIKGCVNKVFYATNGDMVGGDNNAGECLVERAAGTEKCGLRLGFKKLSMYRFLTMEDL